VEIVEQVIAADNFYLSLALIFVFFYLVSQTGKWFVIAKKQKIDVPFWEAFKINLISGFYGLITPGKLGSIIRADYLRKYSGGMGKGISNFVIDKILDLSSLFFLVILLGFFALKESLELPLGYLSILFFALLFFFFIFYNKERSKFLLGIFYRKLIPKRMKKKASRAFDSFYQDLPKKRFLLLFFAFNLISWVINYSTAYFVALSLGIKLNFIYFLAIYPLATLVAQIPITISGLGTREATLIGLFGLFGIGAVKVFSMSLIGLFIMGIFPSLIAILLLLIEK
jgi:hypothetical protein